MSDAASLDQPKTGTRAGLHGSMQATERLQHVGIHTLLVLGAIIVLIPLLWMLSTSLKTPDQVNKWPPIWIPNPATLENYPRALTIFPVPL
jgi:ABC-type glycerol-3-phosphate transport system permease component